MKCHSDEGCCGGNCDNEKDCDELMFDNSILSVKITSLLVYLKQLSHDISDIIVDNDMLALMRKISSDAMHKAIDTTIMISNKAEEITCGSEIAPEDKLISNMVLLESTKTIIEGSNIFYENLHEINLEKL